MENDAIASAPLAPQPPAAPLFCPQCHQPVTPADYYCPNCGKKLSDPPLSTSTGAQIWLYAFSIILPWIAYLAIGYWQGIKYARSNDPQGRQIGYIAIALIALSTIITFWLTTIWINDAIKQATDSVGNLGGF